MSVEQVGPQEWDMKVVWLDTDDVLPNPSNPNEQDDLTFNNLVQSIKEDGWRGPAQVVEIAAGKYELVAGEHRWRAAKVLGTKVPTIILDRGRYEQDRRDWVMVKDNILTGKLNPQKFAALYERMLKTYDKEALQTLMGFTSADAFQKVYKEARRGLPPGLQEALDKTKDEIRTIDDLSNVLNKLFREHGETLDSDYMVFSWGGRNVMWIRCTGPLWKAINRLADNASGNEESLVADLLRRLDPA